MDLCGMNIRNNNNKFACELYDASAHPFYMIFPPSDPPDIAVEKSWIHSGEGFEAMLVCIVHADPSPTVSKIYN